MKKLLILFVIAFFANGFSQYRDSGFPTESVYDGIVKSEPHSLFGFLDSDNLKMSHSFEMSYSTFAGQGLALGSYTNSLSYKFSNSLKFLLETSIVTSPYSSLGKNYQNAINGIYINRAQLNFKPWKNVDVILIVVDTTFESFLIAEIVKRMSSFIGNKNVWAILKLSPLISR